MMPTSTVGSILQPGILVNDPFNGLRVCEECKGQTYMAVAYLCPGCRHVWYCSLYPCAKKHWDEKHSAMCARLNTMNQAIGKRNMAALPQDQLILPHGLSFLTIAAFFETWRSAHGWLFPWACLQGLYVPTDPQFIRTHYLMLHAKPRFDSSGGVRRYFSVKEITTHHLAEASTLIPSWAHQQAKALENVDKVNAASKQLLSFKVHMMLYCPPLEPVMATFGIPEAFVMRDYHRPDWQRVVIADVEDGSLTSPLVIPVPETSPKKKSVVS